MRRSAEHIRTIAKERLRRQLTRSETVDSRTALFDEDFFPRGEKVRRDLGIDYLVAITPDSLARLIRPPRKRRTIYFDFFSSNDGIRNSVVSVDRVRPLAVEANRPYEIVVGYLAMRTALVALDGNPNLEFHEDSRLSFRLQ